MITRALTRRWRALAATQHFVNLSQLFAENAVWICTVWRFLGGFRQFGCYLGIHWLSDQLPALY
ncbi:MAG: hypothetical protein DMG95_00420 [Acidobacteria bacterium]|nr:MAG: hypothetical protein DMG95_00420 [Acidobacteriota bacterium]